LKRGEDAPGHVRVDDEDAVGLLDGRLPLGRCAGERHALVARVVERKVDRAERRLEDGDGEQVDKLDELGDGVRVAPEVRSDDQRALGGEEGVRDALDGCCAGTRSIS